MDWRFFWVGVGQSKYVGLKRKLSFLFWAQWSHKNPSSSWRAALGAVQELTEKWGAIFPSQALNTCTLWLQTQWKLLSTFLQSHFLSESDQEYPQKFPQCTWLALYFYLFFGSSNTMQCFITVQHQSVMEQHDHSSSVSHLSLLLIIK